MRANIERKQCVTITAAQSVAPERIWKWGAPIRHKGGGAPVRRKSGVHRSGAKHRKKFFWSCPSTFLALKVQLVALVSAFVMVSTVWSVSCLLFFYSRCPQCPPICKWGARAPRAPWSRRHCSQYGDNDEPLSILQQWIKLAYAWIHSLSSSSLAYLFDGAPAQGEVHNIHNFFLIVCRQNIPSKLFSYTHFFRKS